MNMFFEVFSNIINEHVLVVPICTTRGPHRASLSFRTEPVFTCIMFQEVFSDIPVDSSNGWLTAAALPRPTGFSGTNRWLAEAEEEQLTHLRVCACAAARRSASGRSRWERTETRASEASSASECAAGARTERHLSITHTHTHTCWFLWFTGTLHRRNGFYTVQTVCAIALHLPYT